MSRSTCARDAALAVAVVLASCGGRTDLLLLGDGGTLDGTTGADSGADSASDSGADSRSDSPSDSGSEGSACSPPGCAPGTSRSCNSYGTQTCSASCDWGACSCASPPVCVPSLKQCSGNGVETCDACGQWGPPASCAPATPFCTNGICTNPPSCQPGGAGMTNCGAGGSGDASCCTSPQIAGGAFYRTYPPGNTANGDEDPATVSGYRLDDYLVTVGRFRQFVNAALPADGGAGWSPPAGSGKHAHLNGGLGLANVGPPGDGGLAYEPGWIVSDDGNVSPTTSNLTTAADCADSPTWTSAAGDQENLPINCVNWWEAYAFCIWDGGFLPSEAEWLYAAAGGSQQLAYPWGSTDPGTTNQYAIYSCNYPTGNGGVDCLQTVANIARVGTPALGVGAFGQLDLVGDVWEWTLDWYAPFVVPCTDCAALTGGSSRVNRGGDWNDTIERVVVPNREGWDSPSMRDRYYGFRCARAP
jgi:sulfatase modifying factor 1